MFGEKVMISKSMGSFVSSFLLPYMRFSRWGEIRGKERHCRESSLLSNRDCLGRTCYTVCGEQDLLGGWENDAGASMLFAVSPHILCLLGLRAH